MDYIWIFYFGYYDLDVPGTTLAAVHYSVNQPLPGTQAGRWNFDIRSKSGKGVVTLTVVEYFTFKL